MMTAGSAFPRRWGAPRIAMPDRSLPESPNTERSANERRIQRDCCAGRYLSITPSRASVDELSCSGNQRRGGAATPARVRSCCDFLARVRDSSQLGENKWAGVSDSRLGVKRNSEQFTRALRPSRRVALSHEGRITVKLESLAGSRAMAPMSVSPTGGGIATRANRAASEGIPSGATGFVVKFDGDAGAVLKSASPRPPASSVLFQRKPICQGATRQRQSEFHTQTPVLPPHRRPDEPIPPPPTRVSIHIDTNQRY